MASTEGDGELTYVGNLLFLAGSFFTSTLAAVVFTRALTWATGIGDGVVTAATTVAVSVLTFVGLLYVYSFYYLDG